MFKGRILSGSLLIMLVIFFSIPVWADVEVQTNSTTLAIPDGTYNGSLASMACSSVNIVSDGTDVVDGAVQVQIAVDHTYVGDLVFKLQSPTGTITTLMSRPGLPEPADDGTGCCGWGADLSSTSPVSFLNSGTTDAEDMGEYLGSEEEKVICQDDGGLCDYYPNPGAGPGTDLADFDGENAVGIWNVCVGDAFEDDIGNLVSWTLTVNTTPVNTASCPLSKGYWKTHSDAWTVDGDDPFVEGATITNNEMMMAVPKTGNAYIILAQQWLAARLNFAGGSCLPPNPIDFYAIPPAYEDSIRLFETYASTLDIPKKSPDRALALQYAKLFDDYNNGYMCPDICGISQCPRTLVPSYHLAWYEMYPNFSGIDEINLKVVLTNASSYTLEFDDDTFQLWSVPNVITTMPVTINEEPINPVAPGGTLTYDLTIDVSGLPSTEYTLAFRAVSYTLGTMGTGTVPLYDVMITCE